MRSVPRAPKRWFVPESASPGCETSSRMSTRLFEKRSGFGETTVTSKRTTSLAGS